MAKINSKNNYRIVSINQRLPDKDGYYYILLDGEVRTVCWFHSKLNHWSISDTIVGVFATLERFWVEFNYIKGIRDADYSKFPVHIEDNSTGLTVFKKELR